MELIFQSNHYTDLILFYLPDQSGIGRSFYFDLNCKYRPGCIIKNYTQAVKKH